MQIIRERKRMSAEYYTHEFVWRHDRNAGFSFPCDENGKLPDDLNPAALENYKSCIDGTYDVINLGIRRNVHRWTQPAIGICERCGEEVYLDSFTNTCERCGADYDINGNMLAQRSQWGEETGEHWSECY